MPSVGNQRSAPANGFGCAESFLFANLREAFGKKIYNFRLQRDDFVSPEGSSFFGHAWSVQASQFLSVQVCARLLCLSYASEAGTSMETGSDCPSTLL